MNTVTGTATVPSYNTVAPEQAFFGGGNGSVAAPTAAKLAGCAFVMTAECVAINLMQFKASNANPIVINPVDPLVVNARSVTKVPAPTLGPTAGVFVPPPPVAACTPTTTTGGTGSVIETCQSQGVMEDTTCVKPWLLNVVPWWTYTCEKSNVTVVTSTCEKTLTVAVNWVPNCNVGDVVATGVKAWDFHPRDCGFWGCDDGYWDNGGAVLAYCDPALPDSINFSYGGTGRVNCGQFGSNPDQRQPVPPPQPNLAAWRPITLPTTVPSSISLPNEAMDVVAGSGCDAAGSCTYTFHIGDGTWGCDPAYLLYIPPQDCGYNCFIPAQYGGTVSGPNPGAICYPLGAPYEPIVIGWDYGPIYGCNPGAWLLSGQCYPVGGPVGAILVNPAPGATFSMTFEKPRLVPQTVDTWVSTCDGLEASPTCNMTGSSCLDGPSTRNINGADVFRQCWKNKYDWECRNAAGPNWCAPLTAEPLCAQVDVDACMSYATDGTCISYMAGYKCTKDMGPPPNVTLTGTGFDIVQDMEDSTACVPLANNVNCAKRSSVCTDTADRNFFGFVFSRPCWSTTDTYTCPAAATSTCQPLVDAGCSVIPAQTQCTSYLPSGVCDVTTYYYECGSPITVTETPQTCDGVPYCINGVCYDRSRPSDPDFGRSVAMMEAAREGGNYIDKATFTIFKGEADFCTRRLLVNCCKGNGAAAPSLTNKAIYTAVDFGRTYAGSMYAYDSLFVSSAPDFLVSGLESLGVTSAVGANTFSAYGVTIGWGPSGFQIVAFDPWTFVAMIVIQIVIAELMSCDDTDKQTAVKKDQGICQHMGSWCSSKFLGSCMEHREGYCCFNTKLAKAVSMQGKTQLGITWGSPQQPNCTGLTIDQINSLDFSRIDLSEFIASISANAIGDADAVGRAITRLTNPNVPPGPPPVPIGSVAGPAPPPPPPPFPPTPPDASMTAVFVPSTVSYGSNLTLTTNTIGATVLSYTCAGPMASAGALPIGLTNTVWVPAPANMGVTTCTFQATGPYTTYSTEAQFTVIPPVPTIVASFAPAVVKGGQPISVTTTTTNAVSLDYSCTGSMPMSGALPLGANMVTPFVAGVVNMGVTNCVFTAKDAIGGMTIANASFTVVPVVPTVTASFAPPVVTVGQTTTVTSDTTDAVSLDYVCTGAMASSGARPVALTSTPIVTTNPNIGLTTCTLTAKSVTNTPAQVVIQVQVNP
ncbi:conjugal transfer protein TraN [Ottowia sp.]|uniref:conjugal transfer protein TraN n=1 Tax=Ottowia sp. TaxID=1898956 RepID=UPI0025E339CE|nr:conjugal transfer protein TraN [Ottowia sp.]MBK6616707.1 conjugal transfer protein TraN [Ottowia sp.]